MRHVFATLFSVLCLCFAATPADAWDEVSHSHVTALAIERVRTPELKAFLNAHRDEVISGSWFPDWIYNVRDHDRNHEHTDYLDLLWADLNTSAVRHEKSYDSYFAHYMGAYAHVLEDRTLDTLFGAYGDEVGDYGRDDMELGMVAIATYGYLKRNFVMTLPVDDIRRLYRKNVFFHYDELNDANFTAQLQRGIDKQDTENRLLRLLSFLTADWSQKQFPFAAAHLPSALGGFNDNADVVAAAWEAIWAKAHGRPADALVYSLPRQGGLLSSLDPNSPRGRIAIAAAPRIDITRISAQDIDLRGDSVGVVPAHVVTKPDAGNVREVALVIAADRPWKPGERYHLSVRYPDEIGKTASFHLDFSAPMASETTAPPSDSPWPFHFGLWGAALLAGMGGALFGAGGTASLAWAAMCRRAPRQGRYGKILAWAGKIVGIGLLAAAIWFLATDGEALITFLRHHH